MDKLLIAGGGTGGHLFPGVALAEEFKRRNPSLKILFAVTGRRVEAEVLDPRGLPSRTIIAAGFKGKGLVGRLRSLASLLPGFYQSIGLLREFGPDLVIGVGGYVSGPVLFAARLLGLPTAIQEQNSIPGLTNRILGRMVGLVFTGFESAGRYFPSEKIRLTGNPIRREIAGALRPSEKKHDLFTILVVGGSQGARAVNQAVVEAVSRLEGRDLKYRLIHQTGDMDLEMVRQAYQGLRVPVEVKAFISDMKRVYLEADLIVCRAGALTVAEVAVMGLPAVFIPLPSAANNHQEENARSLVRAGAAEMILQKDLNADSLSGLIVRLTEDENRLRAMSQAALEAARPRAVEEICDICLAQLVREKQHRSFG